MFIASAPEMEKFTYNVSMWTNTTLIGDLSFVNDVKSIRKWSVSPWHRIVDGIREKRSCSQFHQHFAINFFVQKCFAKLFSSYILALNFFWRKNLCTKVVLKMLMKLTPVVNFINFLWAAFAPIFFWQKNTKPNCS